MEGAKTKRIKCFATSQTTLGSQGGQRVYMDSKGIMVFGSKKDNATLLRNREVILQNIGQRSMGDKESALRKKNLGFDCNYEICFTSLIIST